MSLTLPTHVRPVVFTVAALALFAGCGGPPIKTRDQLGSAVARAAIPSVGAQGALFQVVGQAALPSPQFSVKGADGGEAIVSINAVGAIVGFAAKGVMFDVEFKGFSEGGGLRLDGKVSVLANFEYAAAGSEDPTTDLKLSLVGKLSISGTFSDELALNVRLLTRFKDLSLRDGSIALRLDGSVEAREASFAFTEEDVQVLWKQP